MTDTLIGLGPDPGEIEQFWQLARNRLRVNPVPGYFGTFGPESLAPPAWAFGDSPELADELLALVLAGTKTATAGALWDYEAAAESVPRVGDLSIVLDGRAHPRALLQVVRVDVVPFDEVGAEHARLEGEGDLSLKHWQDVHREYFTRAAEHDRGFSDTMPVVLERFELVYPSLP